MIKRFLSLILLICLSLACFGTSQPVMAGAACEANPNSTACKNEKRQEYEAKMKELEAMIEKAKASKKEAQALANKFASESRALEEEIAVLIPQIEELGIQIADLIIRIETNEKMVEALNQRVLKRMESAQATMHFNPFLDFLLGSKGFEDLMRRTYGLEAITAKESADRQELIDTIEQLNKDKIALDEAKNELDIKRADLEAKQNEVDRMVSYYTQIVAETDEEIDNYRNQYDEAKQMVTSIEWNMDELIEMPTVYSFTSPVPGASISAGVWRYPASFGGGVHLGVDYAVGLGNNIYAPADGVIIVSDDNCPTTGYLGNACGGLGGGVSYGGNQVIMMCSVDGGVYGVSFFHLYSGSAHATGVVTQGTVIGRVGSSGNSTGPHCHIELYYLGPGDNEDLLDYLNRGYSSSFNCGWGSAALNRVCEYGSGAPCRLDGRKYFGK